MNNSNHYSLASPTSLLLDDNQIIERVFSHISNKTTDLGTEVWKEPVQNYLNHDLSNFVQVLSKLQYLNPLFYYLYVKKHAQ